MSRKRSLTFSISTGLLAVGTITMGCDGPDIAVNPAFDYTESYDTITDDAEVDDDSTLDDADGGTDTPDEWEVSVNPCFDDDDDGYFGGGFCEAEDCNDQDPTVYPGAPELCDSIDNDCDGMVDRVDLDGDGHFGFPDNCGIALPAEDFDCNDTDPSVNPDAEEQLCDGVDNDCDGMIDEDDLDETELALCDDACVDLAVDPEHCGACGNRCDMLSCADGACCAPAGAQADNVACCFGDADADGVCDAADGACFGPGKLCTLGDASECCEGTCNDVEAGQPQGRGFCCSPSGTPLAQVRGGALGCCTGDEDDDGVCD